MIPARVIPCLSLVGDSLVKTVKFDNYSYIGDPINTVRIFNELEVDELCFLDIRASVNNAPPNLDLLKQIADECFMPLSYGGGIKDFETAQAIFSAGFEKVVINTAAYRNPRLIPQLAETFGSQAIVGSIDLKKNIWGKYVVYINDGTEKIAKDAVEWAKEMQLMGAGELMITSIDKDGTWTGYDLDITSKLANALDIPVIANGGAGNVAHIGEAVNKGHASAVSVGSMVVYQKKGMGVLVNFPDRKTLERELARK
ncbi:MAG: AglZ/HisF2 family acetamidino modification protein [Flavipsychrobacter sp.]